MSTAEKPTHIVFHKKSQELELQYGDLSYRLSSEFLRVHSPSAEVRGHGEGSEILQIGKRNVELRDIVPVGHYALKLVFSDGHDSGLYSWSHLLDLGQNQEAHWQAYLDKLEAAGESRDAVESLGDGGGVVKWVP